MPERTYIVGRTVIHVAIIGAPGSDWYGHGKEDWALCGARGRVYSQSVIDSLFPDDVLCKRCAVKIDRIEAHGRAGAAAEAETCAHENVTGHPPDGYGGEGVEYCADCGDEINEDDVSPWASIPRSVETLRRGARFFHDGQELCVLDFDGNYVIGTPDWPRSAMAARRVPVRKGTLVCIPSKRAGGVSDSSEAACICPIRQDGPDSGYRREIPECPKHGVGPGSSVTDEADAQC